MRRCHAKRFLFRLAAKLGRVNPYQMARGIPARLIMEWETYAALEPFDEVRADIRSAQIAQMLYNINRDSTKDPKGKPLSEFMLEFDREELTPEEQQRKHDEALTNKMRVAELIMRAQAEAAAEQVRAPKIIEHTYASLDAVGTEGGKVTTEVSKPVLVNDREAAALAAARAAMKDV